jgi:hypothetical protein
MKKVSEAIKEASISVACLLDDVGVNNSGELNLTELKKDIENIQNQITTIENYFDNTFVKENYGWKSLDTKDGYAWFGGKHHSGLFDCLPEKVIENHSLEDIDFLVCGWQVSK